MHDVNIYLFPKDRLIEESTEYPYIADYSVLNPDHMLQPSVLSADNNQFSPLIPDA